MVDDNGGGSDSGNGKIDGGNADNYRDSDVVVIMILMMQVMVVIN